MAKSGSLIEIYCKCDHCGNYFEVEVRRKYCGGSCRKKSYYLRTGKETVKRNLERKGVM